MPIGWRRLAQVAPFVALGIGMGLVTVWWERHHQGTQGKLFAIGPGGAGADRQPGGLVLCGQTALAGEPDVQLSALDDIGLPIRRPTSGCWRRRHWGWRSGARGGGRGGAWRWRRLFFAVTLSPVLGFIMLYTFVYSFVADHYQYLACFGLLALAAAGIEWCSGRLSRQIPVMRPLFCGVLLAALGVLSWRQCRMYSDGETLWRATLARNPRCWLAYDNLGVTLLEKGHLDQALEQYRKAMEINPDDKDVHNNLGAALFNRAMWRAPSRNTKERWRSIPPPRKSTTIWAPP